MRTVDTNFKDIIFGILEIFTLFVVMLRSSAATTVVSLECFVRQRHVVLLLIKTEINYYFYLFSANLKVNLVNPECQHSSCGVSIIKNHLAGPICISKIGERVYFAYFWKALWDCADCCLD